MNKVIERILVQDYGWVSRETFIDAEFGEEIKTVYNGEIEVFTKNGEMALVDWYRQGNTEFNGKYVIAIEYDEDDEAS